MPWLVLIAIVIVTTVSALIAAFLGRRRMGRALGRKVSDAELTSINTWIKVHEAEGQHPGIKSATDSQDMKRWLDPD